MVTDILAYRLWLIQWDFCSGKRFTKAPLSSSKQRNIANKMGETLTFPVAQTEDDDDRPIKTMLLIPFTWV